MKKTFNILLILFFMLAFSQTAFSQDDYYGDYEELPPMKQLFLDLGFGPNGTGAGVGFRYSFFGFGLNLSGFAKSIPNYITYERLRPEDVYSTEKYPTIILSIDGYLFYDIDDYFTLFGNIGLFTQGDSVLARKKSSESVASEDLYFLNTDSSTGVSFGAGIQYLIWENVGLGAGYHSKKGIFAQLSYYWF